MEFTHQSPEHDKFVSVIDGTGKTVVLDREPKDFADHAQQMTANGIWRVAA